MTNYSFNDTPVLRDAESVLRSASFAIRPEYIEAAEAPWLLAEDAFFVIGVVATRTLSDAHRVEAFAAGELLRRVLESNVGAKRWDAYVVMLAEEVVDDPVQTRELVELQHETRGVRRLVATGVTDRAAVVEALRPFLPLPPPIPGGLSDALTDIIDQLVLNGIQRSSAERYVAAFAETGDLDDV